MACVTAVLGRISHNRRMIILLSIVIFSTVGIVFITFFHSQNQKTICSKEAGGKNSTNHTQCATPCQSSELPDLKGSTDYNSTLRGKEDRTNFTADHTEFTTPLQSSKLPDLKGSTDYNSTLREKGDHTNFTADHTELTTPLHRSKLPNLKRSIHYNSTLRERGDHKDITAVHTEFTTSVLSSKFPDLKGSIHYNLTLRETENYTDFTTDHTKFPTPLQSSKRPSPKGNINNNPLSEKEDQTEFTTPRQSRKQDLEKIVNYYSTLSQEKAFELFLLYTDETFNYWKDLNPRKFEESECFNFINLHDLDFTTIDWQKFKYCSSNFYLFGAYFGKRERVPSPITGQRNSRQASTKEKENQQGHQLEPTESTNNKYQISKAPKKDILPIVGIMGMVDKVYPPFPSCESLQDGSSDASIPKNLMNSEAYENYMWYNEQENYEDEDLQPFVIIPCV